MSNREIYQVLKEYKVMVIADSAEPKSIAELQAYGLMCRGCVKGKDSITHGIQLIQQHDILVTKQSVNLIKELRGYVWETDRDNKQTGKPIGFMNHAIDAMRYQFTYSVTNPNVGKYLVI
jgi:phage terminase large subunit